MDFPKMLYLRGDVEQAIVVHDEAEAAAAAKQGYVPTIGVVPVSEPVTVAKTRAPKG